MGLLESTRKLHCSLEGGTKAQISENDDGKAQVILKQGNKPTMTFTLDQMKAICDWFHLIYPKL